MEKHGSQIQGQWTGLGWTLDTGGYIIRESQGTKTLNDDKFKIVFGGESHDLIDAGSGRYRTKEETFWLINYDSVNDSWTVKTKDGTTHRFGSTPGSRQIGMTFALNQEALVTFTYLVDEVVTTSGTAVHYSYFKQSGVYRQKTYDQAVYIDTITYSYSGGSVVGPTREVKFIRGSRDDWKDVSPQWPCVLSPTVAPGPDRSQRRRRFNSALRLRLRLLDRSGPQLYLAGRRHGRLDA